MHYDWLIIGDSIANRMDADGLMALRGLGETYINEGVDGSILSDNIAYLLGWLNEYTPHILYCKTVTNDLARYTVMEFMEVLNTIKGIVNLYGNLSEFILDQEYPCKFRSDATPSTYAATSHLKDLLINTELRNWCRINNVKHTNSYFRLVDYTYANENHFLPAYTDDGLHLIAAGKAVQNSCIVNAEIPLKNIDIWGGSSYPSYPNQSWRTWKLSSGVTISGDADCGTLTQPEINDTADSPVFSLGNGVKKFSLSLLTLNGSSKIQYRSSKEYFLRTSAGEWVDYSSPVITDDLLIQVRVCATSISTEIDSCTVEINPITDFTARTASFGNRSGSVKDFFTDNYVSNLYGANKDANYGHFEFFSVADNQVGYLNQSLIRFGIDSIIDTSYVIESATLKLYSAQSLAAIDISMYRMLTKHGASIEWDDVGGTDGLYQACFNWAVRNVSRWANSGEFSAIDYQPTPFATFTTIDNVIGKEWIIDVTDEIIYQQAHHDYNGWLLKATSAGSANICGQTWETEAYRPKLTIKFSGSAMQINGICIGNMISL
jgi:hypothetical protein